jgi:hypothetical protein
MDGTGSLYVNATLAHDMSLAALAIACGDASSERVSSSASQAKAAI